MSLVGEEVTGYGLRVIGRLYYYLNNLKGRDP